MQVVGVEGGRVLTDGQSQRVTSKEQGSGIQSLLLAQALVRRPLPPKEPLKIVKFKYAKLTKSLGYEESFLIESSRRCEIFSG